MPAVTKNWIYEQGAAFDKRVTWLDKNKRPINLTGWRARMPVMSEQGEQLDLLTSENGALILGGKTGVIQILRTAGQTAAQADFGTARYQLILIPPSGDDAAVRLMQGSLAFSKAL